MAKKQKDMVLPKLPYGQGSMSIRQDGTIMYRKRIGNPKKEKTVYADTPKEAMELMNRIEKDIKNKIHISETATLSEKMNQWLINYKKPKLKKTSYNTLTKTVKSRIEDYDIGNMRLDSLDSDMLQKHINFLNEQENLSFSTIKKCYDALNDFFRHQTLNKKINDNPMLTVVMPNRENVIKQTKTIEFFEEEDIKKFIKQATTILQWSKQPQYQYGFCLSANIFLGMRAGELLALKWHDVDLDKDTIYIHENLQMVKNDEYDDTDKDRMQLQGITKQVYETQSVKNYQNRSIKINQHAKQYLLKQKEYSKFTEDDDYVCCTRDGKHAAITYLSSNIEEIEKSAGTVVTSKGTHVIRHTCASLFFKSHVKIELIASLLGHSAEVCRKTYIHFVEEQEREAVKLIDDFNIDFIE